MKVTAFPQTAFFKLNGFKQGIVEKGQFCGSNTGNYKQVNSIYFSLYLGNVFLVKQWCDMTRDELFFLSSEKYHSLTYENVFK